METFWFLILNSFCRSENSNHFLLFFLSLWGFLHNNVFCIIVYSVLFVNAKIASGTLALEHVCHQVSITLRKPQHEMCKAS